MNKKIVITGATGFIGSNLLAELEQRGYDQLVAVDWFGKENKWLNVAKRTSVYYISPEMLMDYIESNSDSIKCMIHLGAISSTTETDGDAIWETNYKLTIDLFEVCRKKNIQFIYASSAATYGDGSHGFPDNASFELLSALRPLNLYGWSKNQVDLYISRACNYDDQDQQIVGLKFFNVYGPNEYHKGNQKSVIGPFMEQISLDGKIRLFKSNNPQIGDGNQSRDFIYVNDCIDVIIWFIENPQVSGLFNVGTGISVTYNEVAEYISSALNESCEIKYIEMPDNLIGQYQNYTCADISKLRSVGYSKDMTPAKDGIRDYIQNFLTKQDKYI